MSMGFLNLVSSRAPLHVGAGHPVVQFRATHASRDVLFVSISSRIRVSPYRGEGGSHLVREPRSGVTIDPITPKEDATWLSTGGRRVAVIPVRYRRTHEVSSHLSMPEPSTAVTVSCRVAGQTTGDVTTRTSDG